MIPIMGMLTGVLMTGLLVLVVVKVAQSPIGQAIGRRIHGKGGADLELRDELLELREVVTHLEARLAENEERLDFTERLLAQHQSDRLPSGPAIDH
jgi:hypothetical protein